MKTLHQVSALLLSGCLTLLLPGFVSADTQPQQTGQSKCYTSAGALTLCADSGQDGDLRAGIAWPNPRFIDNSDQTVTDRLTGLVWTRDALTAETAACPASGSPITWQQALDQIKCLNSDSFSGQSDWRLPNIVELRSLLNADQPSTANWLGILGTFSNVPNNSTQLFWSATTYAAVPTAAMGVKLGSSETEKLVKTATGYTWPVRGPIIIPAAQLPRSGQVLCYDATGTPRNCTGSGEDGDTLTGTSWPIPRFLVNANQTVTDALTGLTWTQDANLMVTYDQIFDSDGTINDGAVSWDRAIQFVKRLNSDQYKGFNDWRLPNQLEILTLVDHSQSTLPAALTAQGFNLGTPIPSSWWSATTNPGTTSLGQAFSLQGNEGSLISSVKIAHSWVWSVRDGSYGDAVITASPMNINFGTITTGTSAANREIVLTNTTSRQQTLVISSITVEGTDQDLFTVAPGGSTPCTTLAPSILPGANCTLSISFSSPTLGSKAATLKVLSNAVSGPVIAILAGTTVDGTPPTGSLQINDGVIYTNTASVTLTVATSDDAGGPVQMQFSNDLSSWSAWSPYDPTFPYVSWTLAGIDGLKTVYARFKDEAGNVSLLAFATIVLKATPPASASVSGLPNNSITNSLSLLLTVSGTDLVKYMYTLEPASAAGATITPPADRWWPVTTQLRLDNLPEGSYLLTLWGQDIAPNTQVDPTIRAWVIDRTVPPLTIDSVISPTNNATPILSGTTEAGVARVDISIKPQTGATNNGTATVTGLFWTYPVAPGLAVGTNLITVTAFDAAGNSRSATTTIVFDNQPPTATVGGVPAVGTTTSATTATLQVGGNEVVAYKYRLDGGTWQPEQPVSIPIALTNLASGATNANGNWSHTINVAGRDLAGNWQSDSSATSYSWVVDTTPPAIVITAPITPTASGNVILQGTIGEQATVTVRNVTTTAAIQTQVNGQLQWTQLTPMTLIIGLNQLTATAVDIAGNSTSLSTFIEYDPSAPSAAINTDISNGSTITRNSATFIVSGNGVIAYQYQLTPATGFTLPLPQNTEQPVANALTLSGMPDATYTLSVKGIDAAGNIQTTATVFTWTVDAAAPTLAFSSGPANNSITNADSTTFTVNTTTGVVAYKYALDTANYPISQANGIDVNTPISLAPTDLPSGVHTIFAIGRDFYGNWQKTPTSVSWTVDKAAPALNITPPASPTSVKSVSGTAEPGATLTATLDGTAVSSPATVTVPANGTWTYALTSITDGNHNVTITAKDTAGNTANNTVSVNFDGSAPNVIITGISLPVSPNTTGATSAVFSVSANETLDHYTWKIDGGAMSVAIPATQPTQLTVASGTHTLTVDGYDLAGNKGTAPVLTWTVATSNPNPLTVVATVTGAPAGKTNFIPSAGTPLNIVVGGVGVANYSYSWVTPTPAGIVATPAGATLTTASTPISLTSMPEGAYILKVKGFGIPLDQVYETVVSWVVDRSGPTATVGNVPVGKVPVLPATTATPASNATTLNLTVGGTDVVAYRYKLVTVPSGATATPTENTDTPIGNIDFTTTNGFPEGSYTLAVIGQDSAGNWQVDPSGSWWTNPAATTVSFTIDRTNPTLTISSPANNITINANNQLLTGTANDSASPVVVRIYRGLTLVGTVTPVSGAWSYKVQGLATGPNSIRVEVVDNAGNAVSITQTINLTTTLPTAVLQANTIPPALTTTQDATIVVTGTNNVVAYRYRLNGGVYIPAATDTPAETPIATAITLTAIPEGTRTLEVIGKDIAGNWQESPTTVLWTIDRTPPTAVISPPVNPAQPINATRMVFEVGGTDVVAYKYSINNGAYSTSERLVKLPIDLTGLTAGPHTLKVIGRDLIGNWQDTAVATAATWVVEITSPQITVNPFTTPTALSQVSLSGTVTVAAAASLTSFSVVNSTTNNTVVSTPPAGTSWSADVPLSNGLNKITVTATDSAGNVNSLILTIELKASAPTATILSGTPPVQTNATSINLAIGGSGVIAYKYRLDADADYGNENQVGTQLALGPLAEGAHTLWIIGRDSAGNWQADASATKLLWVIDTTPPALSLNPLTTPTSALVQTIRGTIEAGCTVNLGFDSGAIGGNAIVTGTNWQFTTLNATTTGLQPGVNNLTIIATDPAGNKTTLTTMIEYDTVLPIATLTGAPPVVTRATGATFLVGGNGVVAYTYNLDNSGYSGFSDTSVPISLTGLTDGSHTLMVLGRKQSGLVQITPTVVTWTVDTTPPIATFTAGRPTAQTKLQDLTVEVGGIGVVLYRYSLDGEPYSTETPIAIPISRSGLLVGTHILNIIGRDEAGNWQTVPTQTAWTIDITPPAGVLIGGKPTILTNINALTLAISGADVAFYQYKIDNETFSDPIDVATLLLRTNIPDGSHTISIRGVDLAGNVQVVPNSFTWTIDTVAPTTTASPGGGEYDNTLQVILTTSEPATIYFTIDGTTPTINSTIYTTPLSIGKTTSLHFFSRDLAGNLEPMREVNYTFIANGDIDGDGRITVADALKVIRHVVKLEMLTAEEFKRADVATNSISTSPLSNNRPKPDGKVDIVDLQILLQLIVRILSW